MNIQRKSIFNIFLTVGLVVFFCLQNTQSVLAQTGFSFGQILNAISAVKDGITTFNRVINDIKIKKCRFQLTKETEKTLREEGASNELISAIRENSVSTSKPSDPDTVFAKALKEDRNKQYDLAISDYTKVIQADAKYASAYNNRGNIYIIKGKLDLAIADFNNALALEPQTGLYFHNRGFAYFEKGDCVSALKDFNKGINLGHGTAISYYHRGDAYACQNQYKSAITDYTKTIQINPAFIKRDLSIYHSRGIMYGNLGENDLAIADLTKAIQYNPKAEQSYYNRGFVYARLKKYDLAIADYTQAIQIAPQSYIPYLLRADAYLAIGKNELAAADRKKGNELKNQK